MNGRVGCFNCHYRVSGDSAGAYTAAARLDNIARSGQLAAALGHILDKAGPDGPVYILRRLDAPVSLNLAKDREDSVLARQWASQLANAALRQVMRGVDSYDFVRFDNQEEFLARFVIDLVRGEAWNRWFYNCFSKLRSLPAAEAITSVLLADRERIPGVLSRVHKANNLDETLAALDPSSLRQLWASGLNSLPLVSESEFRPLFAAALELAALAVPIDSVPAERWFGEYLQTSPAPPDWRDSTSLTLAVVAAINFLLKNHYANTTARSVGQELRKHPERMRSRFDWIDLELLIASVEAEEYLKQAISDTLSRAPEIEAHVKRPGSGTSVDSSPSSSEVALISDTGIGPEARNAGGTSVSGEPFFQVESGAEPQSAASRMLGTTGTADFDEKSIPVSPNRATEPEDLPQHTVAATGQESTVVPIQPKLPLFSESAREEQAHEPISGSLLKSSSPPPDKGPASTETTSGAIPRSAGASTPADKLSQNEADAQSQSAVSRSAGAIGAGNPSQESTLFSPYSVSEAGKQWQPPPSESASPPVHKEQHHIGLRGGHEVPTEAEVDIGSQEPARSFGITPRRKRLLSDLAEAAAAERPSLSKGPMDRAAAALRLYARLIASRPDWAGDPMTAQAIEGLLAAASILKPELGPEETRAILDRTGPLERAARRFLSAFSDQGLDLALAVTETFKSAALHGESARPSLIGSERASAMNHEAPLSERPTSVVKHASTLPLESERAGVLLLIRAMMDFRLTAVCEVADYPLIPAILGLGICWGGQNAIRQSQFDHAITLLAGQDEPVTLEELRAAWREIDESGHALFQDRILALLSTRGLLDEESLELHRCPLLDGRIALVAGARNAQLWPLVRIAQNPVEEDDARQSIEEAWLRATGTATSTTPASESSSQALEDALNAVLRGSADLHLEDAMCAWTLALASVSILRLWAIWLKKFSHSSTPYLLRNFIRRPGEVWRAKGGLFVRLAPQPMDIVLEMAGYFESFHAYSKPWQCQVHIHR